MRPHSTFKLSSLLDTTAVGLSGLCLVHCLALPLLIAVFPLLSVSLIDHESFHQIILVAVIPTTVFALATGYRRHRSLAVVLLGSTGVGALIFAAFALHAMHALALETAVTIAGGLILALAHVGNFRRCRHNDHTPLSQRSAG